MTLKKTWFAIVLCSIGALASAGGQAATEAGGASGTTAAAPTDAMGMPVASTAPTAGTQTDDGILDQWPLAYPNAAAGWGYGGMSAGGTGGMGCMSGMGMMSGMGTMAGTGSMPGMGAMTGTGVSTGLAMTMDQGSAIRYLVQLVTLQDILQTLQNLVAIQQKALVSGGSADQQALAASLAGLAEKIDKLLQENRAQIVGFSDGQ